MLHSNLARLYLGIAGFFLLLGLFYLPYRSVRNHTIAQFNAEQLVNARQAANNLEDFFSTYTKALRYLATQPAIVDLDTSGKTLLDDFFAIHTREIIAIARVNAEGAVSHGAPLLDERAARGIAERSRHLHPEKDHRLLISDPFELSPGVQAIVYAYPVMHEDRHDGYVSLLVSLERLVKEQVDALQLDKAKELHLSNGQGLILYSPIAARIGKPLTAAYGLEQDFLAPIRQMQEKKPGTTRFFVQDAAHQAVCVPVALPGDSFWFFSIVTPEDFLLGSMEEFSRQWLLITTLVVSLLALFGLLLQYVLGRSAEERSLRKAEEQLIHLLEGAPVGIAVIDAQGIIRYCNNMVLELLGTGSKEQVTGHCALDFVHAEDHERVREGMRLLVEGNDFRQSFIRLQSRDGEVRETEIVSAPYTFAGQPCFIMLVSNVTESRRLEENRRLLAIAIEQARESVVITNRDGLIEYVNPAFSRVSGYQAGEVLGHNLRTLQADQHNGMWDTLTGGMVWEGRLVNRRKDGGLYTEQSSISPVRNDQGQVTHFVAVKRDISHEAVLEEKLQQALKMEAIGTLAGGIAHDFNNILGAILGFTDLSLMQCDESSPIHENLINIRKGGKRAADLVQQILTFSRQKPLHRTAITVAPLLREGLRLLRSTLPATIEIRQQFHAGNSLVVADPVHIQQIIMNLGTNAYHAMRERGGVLTVRLFEQTSLQGEGQLVLEVEDEGEGMEQKVRERIFDPFYTTKAPGQGTGLGLSVVHGIVQELKGDIQVYSSPGQGSVFRIILPLAPAVAPDTTDGAQQPLPAGSGHILLIDDEPDLRSSCQQLLCSLGYQVTSFADPREGVQLIKSATGEEIDLLITDQTMPGMTGADLLLAVQRIRPQLPVIICTGFSHELDEEKALALGARGLVMKPVDYHKLLNLVREILDQA